VHIEEVTLISRVRVEKSSPAVNLEKKSSLAVNILVLSGSLLGVCGFSFAGCNSLALKHLGKHVNPTKGYAYCHENLQIFIHDYVYFLISL
jgi:hypothetical protein